jgi:hypothetical protein
MDGARQVLSDSVLGLTGDCFWANRDGVFIKTQVFLRFFLKYLGIFFSEERFLGKIEIVHLIELVELYFSLTLV